MATNRLLLIGLLIAAILLIFAAYSFRTNVELAPKGGICKDCSDVCVGDALSECTCDSKSGTCACSEPRTCESKCINELQISSGKCSDGACQTGDPESCGATTDWVCANKKDGGGSICIHEPGLYDLRNAFKCCQNPETGTSTWSYYGCGGQKEVDKSQCGGSPFYV